MKLGLWAGSVLGPWVGSELGPWAGSVLGTPVWKSCTGVIHFKSLALKAGFALTALRSEGGESRRE